MTKEEAIKEIKDASDEVLKHWYLENPTIHKEAEARIEAFDMAIRSLSNNDKICDEMEIEGDIRKEFIDVRFSDGTIKKVKAYKKRVRKVGRWIPQFAENGDDYFEAYDIKGVRTFASKYKCSECGFVHTVIEDLGIYEYCPNCGAKMEVE